MSSVFSKIFFSIFWIGKSESRQFFRCIGHLLRRDNCSAAPMLSDRAHDRCSVRIANFSKRRKFLKLFFSSKRATLLLGTLSHFHTGIRQHFSCNFLVICFFLPPFFDLLFLRISAIKALFHFISEPVPFRFKMIRSRFFMLLKPVPLDMNSKPFQK